MTAISKLQYANRFGNEIARLAHETALAAAPSLSHLPPRYSRWFHGADRDAGSSEEAGQRYRQLHADMTAMEIAVATRNNLTALGEDASDLIAHRLPDGHRMRKAIRSAVLPDAPFLGTCKFGEIIHERNAETLGVTQIFVANFHGEIDTERAGSIYRPSSPEFDQMFFGIHIIVDRFGSTLGFDYERGKKGLAFKTRDTAEALYSIASASTGLSREALLARATRRAA